MSNLKKEVFKEAYRKAYNLDNDYVIPIYKDNEKLFHVGKPLKKLYIITDSNSKNDVPYWVVATWTTNNDSLYEFTLNGLVKGVISYLKIVKKV